FFFQAQDVIRDFHVTGVQTCALPIQDSFAPGEMENLLEGPVYTKPSVWRGREVPPVLLSGNHGAVDRWRRDQALRKTARNRPELLERIPADRLDRHDQEVLEGVRLQAGPESMAD